MATTTRLDVVPQARSSRPVAAIREALRRLEAGQRPGDADGLLASLRDLEGRARHLQRLGGPYATVRLSPGVEALRAALQAGTGGGLADVRED